MHNIIQHLRHIAFNTELSTIQIHTNDLQKLLTDYNRIDTEYRQLHSTINLEYQTLIDTIECLWSIIDDIDYYGDMAKGNDKLFRNLTEKRQSDRWSTGITTDGYTLDLSKIKQQRK